MNVTTAISFFLSLFKKTSTNFNSFGLLIYFAISNRKKNFLSAVEISSLSCDTINDTGKSKLMFPVYKFIVFFKRSNTSSRVS